MQMQVEKKTRTVFKNNMTIDKNRHNGVRLSMYVSICIQHKQLNNDKNSRTVKKLQSLQKMSANVFVGNYCRPRDA